MRLRMIALVFIASAVVGYTQKPQRSLIDEVAGVREIGRIVQDGTELQRPKMSPDGRSVAFTSVSPQYALWICRLDDLKPKLLVETGSKLKHYGWSPESQQIAYVDGRTVKLINVMTKEVTSFNTGSPFVSGPVFDAEGNLAFVANTDPTGNPAALDGDVEKVKAMTPKDRPYLQVVNPKAKKQAIDDPAEVGGERVIVPYVFSSQREVYLNVNGEDQRITPVKNSRAVAPCLYASLSLDSNKVALDCDGMGSNLSIYEITTKRIYDLGAMMFRSWSPDSEWVLCREEISDGHAVFWNDLYITHYTGGKKVKIVRAKGIAHGASWGKDNLIAYDEEGKIVIDKILLK